MVPATLSRILMQSSLVKQLAKRAEAGKPLRVGVIGAGKFATMFLSQARRLPGLHVLGVADLSQELARLALSRAHWPEEQYAADSFTAALKFGSTCICDNAESLLQVDGLDIVVESTGDPGAGIDHALKAFQEGVHVVMVNVEADAVAGPLLARRAREAGVVYSLAYGDQPALICELVDWARSTGFDVVCAGKGTSYLPIYHSSTPETVWDYYGLNTKQAADGGLNTKMFNSFLDGTKSAIEMAAVANATGLKPQPEGLSFPPCGVNDLPEVCRPRASGGQLSHSGTVEVVSSLERDGSPVFLDLRWGVYVTLEAPNEYVMRCFSEYGMVTDSTGRYTALYRPAHLIGLELSISVLKVGLRGEATGSPCYFRGDVAATAKRSLSSGEVLDGEGGYCVYGTLMSSEQSVSTGTLPIGLSNNLVLLNDIPEGQTLLWSDVKIDSRNSILRFRKEMERVFGQEKEGRG